MRTLAGSVLLVASLVACLVAGCGGPSSGELDAGSGRLDASGPEDGSLDGSGPTLDAPLPDYDGTPRLSDCPEGPPSRCAGPRTWDAGRWSFHFACPITSRWRVTVEAASQPSQVRVDGLSGTIVSSASPALSHELSFTSHEELANCVAIVEMPVAGTFSIAIVQLEGPLDELGCDELCLADSTAGTERGCDCARTCHDACTDLGTDCGLPCNRDVPGYDCPFLEGDIQGDPDCTYYEDDTGSFEHRGQCYRCGTGQQCCYTDGHDNGTGSYDLCPPLDPGENDPDPNGCSGVFDHCDCDVTPLCGCMAESGDLALCGECIGESSLDLTSCNAPGDDGTFCQRAADAALAGFSWCDIVGDIDRCMDRPADF